MTATPSPRAPLMLVLLTLFWGLSFPLGKTWQEHANGWEGGELLATLTMLGLRMLCALVVLLCFQPRLLKQATGGELRAGGLLGLINFSALTLQFWGVAHVSPAVSAFLTSLASLWVPILGFLLFGIIVRRLTWLGLLIALAGVAILTVRLDKVEAFGFGEMLTLAASIVFGFQIICLDRLGQAHRGEHLTVGVLGATAIAALLMASVLAGGTIGIGAWVEWCAGMLSQQVVLISFVVLVLLPTVLSFHWMNVYQPQVPAGQAALIYLLEPVFASLFSVPWGYDTITGRLIVGGMLILSANALVELRREGILPESPIE